MNKNPLKWFRRQRKPSQNDALHDLTAGIRDFMHALTNNGIKHEVTYGLKPRPYTATPVLRDQMGREYLGLAINLTDKYTVPVRFPLSFVTGKEEDISTQFEVGLRLHYEPQRRSW